MAQSVPMRSGRDRLRYTLSFETLLMAILIPAGMLFFDKGVEVVGTLGIILSLKAMLVNLIYNWIFDRVDARAGRVSSDRKTLGRFLHAIGFEVTLLITSLPIYMWFLELTLWQAVLTDLVVTSFVVIYTYVFTLIYDRLYPVV